MKPVTRILDKVLSWSCVALFTLLVVVVVWQVIARQVLNSPSTWTEEVSRYIFVWLGLFASALVFSERGHIAVDFIVRLGSRSFQRIVGIVVQLAIITFALVVLVYGGWRAGQGAWNQSLQSLPFTLGQMYLVMPLTGILMTIYALDNLLDVVRGAADPFPEEIESEAAAHLENADVTVGADVTTGATSSESTSTGSTSTTTDASRPDATTSGSTAARTHEEN